MFKKLILYKLIYDLLVKMLVYIPFIYIIRGREKLLSQNGVANEKSLRSADLNQRNRGLSRGAASGGTD